MKKPRLFLNSQILRLVLYRSITKCAVALVLVLLWDRYINHGLLSAAGSGCFVMAVCLFAMAWFTYLRMDGMTIHHLLEERRKKPKKKRHFMKDIVDYADEHVVSFDELTDEERQACGLLSSLLSGLLFLIASILASILAA